MITMSKGDSADIQKLYDAISSWLRDCVRKDDIEGAKHAEAKMKVLDYQLASVESLQGGEYV